MTRPHLVSHFRRHLFALFAVLLIVPAAGQTLPYLFEPADGSPPNKIVWQTEPGIRYDLWKSNDLSDWKQVPGYPAAADSLAMEYAFTPGPKGFFKILPIDEQPPVVVAQFPAVDGFAVGRFADLSIELADATGIDPASIRLTVGASGPLFQGAPGLTISGNTITYDSGDTALGPWGATVTATLVAADTLGYSITHTWSFRLEPEPQTAANIFVFGSPTAQRAGQEVSGPAAALASRYPAPVGPQKAAAPPTWSIDSVLVDRVVIVYQAGGMPTFTAGQLICNLAPTKENEIFYRRVVSTSNDAVNLKLSVMTSDAALTDFVSQGATSLSQDSVVYELGAGRILVRALSVSSSLTFPRLGIDLSGASLKLRSDGYEASLGTAGHFSVGSAPDWLNVSLPEFSWWFTPSVRAGLELDFSGLKSFEAIACGQVSEATRLQAEVALIGASSKTTFDFLPEAMEPRHVIYMGQLGLVPVFATIGFDASLESKAEAKALMTVGATYRQDINANFGVTYDRTNGRNWIHSFQATSPDLACSASVSGEFSLKLTLDPRVEFLVYGLAGFKVAIDPSATITTTYTPPSTFDGKLEADADFVLGTAGPAFDFLGVDSELSVNIWHGEWPLTPQTLAFKTQPYSRTAAPGDDVSFTCTVDSPSTPTFQWYSNGRAIPGQTSRNLFLPQVNTGHAGIYQVKAKEGNLTADSATAMLTVQTTTPATLDTDGDSIPDIYETNTGIWVSATNRGTSPYKWDSDGDGLSDCVETHTGIYVSRSNTGTDPNKADTDGDGVDDKREIDLGTNPSIGPAPTGFALIPAGSFTMGDQSSPLVGYSDELPVHSVYVSGFYMGKYEVTKEEWDAVRAWGMANGHGYTDLPVGGGKAANHPVHSITWYAMVKWCNARSEKENLTPCYTVSGSTYKTGSSTPVCNWSANGYRLPSEAEWEKAARGGASGQNFPWGNTISQSQANYRVYSSNGTTNYYGYDVTLRPPATGTYFYHPTYAVNGYPYTSPVGSFSPNGYGLYDMAGNLWEWCWDWYGTYPSTSQTDPRGAASGSRRVLRGGYWYNNARGCRVAYRGYGNPTYSDSGIGFRVARSSVP